MTVNTYLDVLQTKVYDAHRSLFTAFEDHNRQVSALVGKEYNERKEKALGLNTAATDYYKQGRYWTAMTKWIDPESRRLCIISTNKDQSAELVSV